MLNIQYGSKEFNFPYALTKSIGEVWLVAATVQTFFPLLMKILNTIHNLQFIIILLTILHFTYGPDILLYHANQSCATTAVPLHINPTCNKAQNMTVSFKKDHVVLDCRMQKLLSPM